MQAVHTPIQAPQKFRKMYKNIANKKRRNYAATATAMDSMIGDVVELYKQFGYWENTIVVFSSGIFPTIVKPKINIGVLVERPLQ